MSQYSHTQTGWLHWLLHAIGFAQISVAIAVPMPKEVRFSLALAAVVILLLGFSFQKLTVTDCGDTLHVSFGPLPLFRRTIRYSDIQDARPGKTSLIDGWGIHYLPGRGWVWNIHGRDCVEITFKNGSTLRIGTDEPDRLADVIRRHLDSDAPLHND